MRRLLAPLLSLLLVPLAACGDDAGGATTTTVIPGVAGSLHVSGGFAPIDETWIVAADGTVLGPDGYTGMLTPAGRTELEAAVTAAGFFDLEDDYLPDDQCCDRRLYELTLTRDGVTHTVTTLDGAAAPEALFRLIQTFLEVTGAS